MTRSIDLNADLGEDESEGGIARDIAIMGIVSSCNIACGGHAGSPANMRRMLATAGTMGVAAGAHPSYPDRQNFGRVSLNISQQELRDALESQLDTIKSIASEIATDLTHIKPHGALYNDTQDREDLIEILVALATSNKLPLVGMPQSLLQKQAQASNVPFIAEAFVDRQYTDSARLLPRSKAGAVIERDPDRLKQGLALASGQPITSNSGNFIRISAQTLCLHSDSTGALETARAMRENLEQAEIEIKAITFG